jgi:3-hydroxyisobutyrate dehydrogenase/2-hydroxy-3-oxopropionate reductase
MPTRIAFLGLGTMGFPIAGHLSRMGFEVCVHNRSPDKADAWLREHGGVKADTPRDAAMGAALVFMCLGNDADVKEVVTSEKGALAGMQNGSILVDHTTTSARLARELAALCSERSVAFLDAPVSGGQIGAINGTLTVMVGGEQSIFERALPAFQSFARRVELIGPSGSGQLCKMVNQICIASLLQGLSEGLRFGERAGLDMHRVVSVISQGAAQSWQMDNRAETMLRREFDFGFAVDWMCKDLGFCIAEAQVNGAELSVTTSIAERYTRVQAEGGGRYDTSSLITLLR